MRPCFALATSIALAAACTGCKSGGKQLPNQVNIDISPTEQSWTVTKREEGCTYVNYDTHQDTVATVRISDGQGRALGGTNVLFSLSLSGNSYDTPRNIYEVLPTDYLSGLPVSLVELYHDSNGDMRPQADELVSGMEDALFTAVTDRYNGAIQLIVRMNLSCDYSASLMATVAGFRNSVEFSVVYEDDESTAADDDGAADD